MSSSPTRSRDQRGAALLIVLLILAIVTLAALSLLHGTDAHRRAARSYADAQIALFDTDAAVHELLWRLDLPPTLARVPAGCLVSVNQLVDYPARIDWDARKLLTNGVDDDRDGVVDEADELNLLRDWTVRIVLDTVVPRPGAPWEILDGSIATGPPWGDAVVVPTIQPKPTWRSYTTAGAAEPDVLVLRYLLDTDTAIGDSERDGPEIVFWDPALETNKVDDKNTLIGLGGDGNPDNDSAFNLTWSDGKSVYRATGSPVLLARVTGSVMRGGKPRARRRIEAELVGVGGSTAGAGWAVCGCSDVDLGGSVSDSYRSSEGAYGIGPIRTRGDALSNAGLQVRTDFDVAGSVVAGGAIDVGKKGSVSGDATAGIAITNAGTIGGIVRPFQLPVPAPCDCGDEVASTVAAAAKVNDNASILPNGTNPYVYPSLVINLKHDIYKRARELELKNKDSIILGGGTFYFDRIALSGDAVLQVGRDTNGDGVIDASPSGPVHIFVAGEISLSGDSAIRAMRPTDLVLVTAHTGKAALQLTGDAVIHGAVEAPLGEATLSGASALFGSLRANTVETKGQAAIHRDEDLGTTASLRRHRIVSWREIE